MNNDLIKKADIQRIAEEGAKIYERVKADFDPKEKGKFLAIEIGSGKVYLGDTSAAALELARTNHPDTVFYVVKIGFDVAETIAKSFLKNGYMNRAVT